MASDRTVDSNILSKIAAREKRLAGEDGPTKDGPPAQAQKHAGENITGRIVSDIAQGENRATRGDVPIQGGPGALIQRLASPKVNPVPAHTARLGSHLISATTVAGERLTGQSRPVKGGLTAQAQRHAGEQVPRRNSHAITNDQQQVTGDDAVKRDPAATVQSEPRSNHF
ncbi:hypothetical protein GGS23DRAFT_550428 [Durotheca rogersii]|uniref:uncharacterized protein n=1 Tax=Durotheca rogersii TaxID=419775 RepID=UPI00221F9D04|nr:uncharacterized protein GGS23DRAFT_550428 [Durotheca rogersii]KAI5867863.1 hypothetical protein GGS23DRAFT_550428 [Durotheca rogersii]